MAGKRLVAAGVFAAAMAAAAALWAAPTTPPAVHSALIRHLRATVATVPAPQAGLATAKSALQSGVHAPSAGDLARGLLIGLALFGVVLLARRRPTPAVARVPRRDRAPPRPPSQDFSRTRWR